MDRPTEFNFLDRYSLREGQVLMTGLQALVRIPMDQFQKDQDSGIRLGTYVSGYQGSPLGTVEQQFERASTLMEGHHIHFEPGVNEEIAATAITGTQLLECLPHSNYDGVLGMWFGKGPGVDRSGDAFRHGVMTGTSRYGAVLTLAGDDPSCKSSTIPSDTTPSLFDVHIPTLYPGNQQEILELGLHGVALSRFSGVWAGIKIVTDVADSGSVIDVFPEQALARLPELMFEGKPFSKQQTFLLLAKKSLEAERQLLYEKMEAAKSYVYENHLDRIEIRSSEDRIGIVAFGKTYYDLKQAFQQLDLSDEALKQLGIRLYKMALIAPVEPKRLAEFSEGLDEILVVEEKRGFTEILIRNEIFNVPHHPQVYGKKDRAGLPLFQAFGDLSISELVKGLAKFLNGRFPHLELEKRAIAENETALSQITPFMARTPYFCSGCPHNTSTRNPENEIGGAGIGCHTMAMTMDRGLKFVTQMGGEGANWMGLSHFTDKSHFIQNIGDGTYFHSASKAVEACIASGANMTFKILFNATVAMTGGQNVAGSQTPMVLAQKLALEGVKKVIIVTEEIERYPKEKTESKIKICSTEAYESALEELRGIQGVTVLIYDQECAAEKRRKRKRGMMEVPKKYIYINPEVCEGCGDCGVQSNCLSVIPIETEYGQKRAIHQSSCNFDYSCLKGDCPSFMSIDLEPGAEKIKPSSKLTPLLPEDLAEAPHEIDIASPYRILLSGIGGTGVVTISILLTTAAHFEGKYASHLDQTGLAQKGGAVTSNLCISDRPIEGSVRIPPGGTDVLLAFDFLSSISPDNLERLSAQRTNAVVNTRGTNTAQSTFDGEKPLPSSHSMQQRLRSFTKGESDVYVDANSLTLELFGDEQPNNIFLLGIAVQKGLIPLKPESIERAIQANRVAVEQNLQAFRWGRQYAEAPEKVKNASPQPLLQTNERLSSLQRLKKWEPNKMQAFDNLMDQSPKDEALQKILESRVADLILYQNVGYAKKYLNFVLEVHKIEKERLGNTSHTDFSQAVAKYLFKLMAYKDEYEVARLWLQSSTLEDANREFQGNVCPSIYILPPILRKMGWTKKIKLSEKYFVFLQILTKLKSLRGTPLDVFGHAKLRRAERELIPWYRQLVEQVTKGLTPENLADAIDLVSLPDQIRGYEDIRAKNIAVVKEEAQTKLNHFQSSHKYFSLGMRVG